MQLYKVTTVSQSMFTYWFKADSEEQIIQLMKDTNFNNLDDAKQKWLGETIVEVVPQKRKHFVAWLDREREIDDSSSSYWLEDELIEDITTKPNVGVLGNFTSTDDSQTIEDVTETTDKTSHRVFRHMCSNMIIGCDEPTATT